MNSFVVLKAAINKVPALKYALGIAGVCAAISIIKLFGIENYVIPIKSICIFLILMLLLYIFSRIAISKDRVARNSGHILVYVTVFLICTCAILFASSIFFNYPKAINEYPFFREKENNLKKDTTNITAPLNEASDKTKSYAPDKSKAVNEKKEAEELLEISIQLESASKGFSSVKVDGKNSQILSTSTPLNPRILVKSNPFKNQIIEIMTVAGDTCVLNRIFDKNRKKDFPIRFTPDCKTKLSE